MYGAIDVRAINFDATLSDETNYFISYHTAIAVNDDTIRKSITGIDPSTVYWNYNPLYTSG